MSLLEEIRSTNQGAAVGQLAEQFGISRNQVENALGQLLPGLSSGVKRNLDQPNGLEDLLGAIKKSGHEKYLDSPAQLGGSSAVVDGDGILGHLLGNKDMSRELAGRAAERTGLDSSILKKMLPLAAGLLMGVLGKKASNSGMLGTGFSAGQGAANNPLAALLDSDNDGSIIDDIIGLASKFVR